MSYFAYVPALINGKGVVADVIRADQEFIDGGYVGDPSLWWQTSYNTRGNVYYIPNSYPPEPDPDQSKALRANYAGLGYTLDATVVQNGVAGVFYAPDPGEGYVLDTQTWLWVEV
jgi:hypothetical protein